MNSFSVLYLILFMAQSRAIETNSTRYEDAREPGGMVSGSWSIGGDYSLAYECSGIAGATDC